jgi:heat shock protein HslJ
MIVRWTTFVLGHMRNLLCTGSFTLKSAKSVVEILLSVFSLLACSASHNLIGNSDQPTSAPVSLTGTEWVLQDLAGTPALASVKATLAFPETGRATGNASCNGFTGAVVVSGDTLKFGPLASTRMACADNAVSTQETEYLKALGAAKRFEWKDPTLLISAEGYDKPLRFTRITPAKR